MSEGHIVRGVDRLVYERGGGITTRPYVGTWLAPSAPFTTGETIFPPGAALERHSHNVDESVLVLEGEATAEIGDERFDLVAGDASWAPAGVVHRFLNRGAGTLRIYWVYAGGYVTRTIESTGVTLEHLSPTDQGGHRLDA